MKKVLVISLLVLVSLSLVLSGCSSSTGNSTEKAVAPLKMGALSMLPILPLHVAQQEGLFQSQGLNVEIVPFRSQLDRDTALLAGQIDCAMEDIYMVPLYNKDGDNIKIVAAEDVGSYMFAIIASPQSNIKSPADLKNVEVASSLGNIIEYVTDKMCLNAGLQQADIKKNSVPSMPLRLEMLNQEKIQAATFSRPLSDAALASGCKLVCDDSQNSLMTVCILFSSKVLKDRTEDVKKFLKAWSSAAEKISADPSKYRALLVSTANIPANLADKIDVPKFDALRMPKLEEYQTKMDWNIQKGNLSKGVAFEDVLANGYLP